MNAQALGPVAQLDDASISQRGAGFPPTSTPTIQARLSPVLGPNGAGLRLSGTF